ncbi:hypothetical protein [Flavobacterium aquicola]|uniref:DUF4836 family protein n=1 Tax=Flavobacterium aquicola TaxID=1682742 RepID=A0A3E0E2I9_9FLAO|nr:hypothetical protein [Flavobacterium aquicola]REG91156.1 hypothetical protein C8P67_11750 [Flavobacterium aquicola]
MKKYFLLLVICFYASIYAQDLANKVPQNSPFALCINSKNLNDKVALKTIQEYPWMQALLDKELKFLPKDLSQTGIDITRNQYHYYSNRDTVMNYVVLIPLNNAVEFEKLIQSKYGDSLKVTKQANYSNITASKNHHLAWNDKFAVLINSNYTKPYKNVYNEPYSDLALMDSTSVLIDSAAMSYEIPEEIKPAPEPKKTKTSKTSKNSKLKKGKKAKKTVKVPVITEPTEEEIYAKQEKAQAELEETNRKLEDLEYKKTDSIERAKINSAVDLIFKETFDPASEKAVMSSNVFKNNDPKSDFYAFADLDILTSQLFSSFAGGNAALMGIYKNGLLNSNYHINTYFEKEKIRFNQVLTPKNDEIKKSYQEMFDSRIDKNLLNYIGNNILGYYSISMDTEAIMNYEYKVMKNTLSSVYQAYSKEASGKETDVLIDAIALVLDEKAIADLIPGNAVFVLHDLKKVQRDYVTFEYNENYEQVETKSNKEEIQPDFTFLVNTRNETFVDKLLKLPLNTDKFTGTDYKFTNGYYTIHFEKDNVLENLYFGLKNGVFMVTTSKENVENLIQQKVMPLQADFKKMISKNNSSAWFDVQKIITASKTELEKDAKNNYWDIALKNAGEITAESKFKNGTITSELSYTIKGEHANSLQYFFDVINDVYTEKQKESAVTE